MIAVAVRRVAIVLFIAITMLSIDFRMFVDVAGPRDALLKNLARADRVPGFAAFLEGVRAHTQRDETIALVVAAPDPATYGYGFIRASYLLAGRTVIPIEMEDGKFRSEAVRRAKYLAVFRLRYAGRGQIVWQGRDGVLVKQR
jgi:hypothetical protein